MVTAQNWDPDRYRRNAAFVAELGMPVVDLLAPMAGERILDLGCGDGALSEKLQDLGCAVVGVDGAAEQVMAARARGLEACVADGQRLSYQGEFDAVFSNAALHWMKRDPDAVIAGVYRALKPGGRFVAEMGGGANVAVERAALHAEMAARGLAEAAAEADPWFFPSALDYRERLEKAGFSVHSLEMIERPTPIPGAMEDWLDTFAEAFINRVPAADRAGFKRAVADRCAPALRGSDGRWVLDYVRLRFKAVKP